MVSNSIYYNRLTIIDCFQKINFLHFRETIILQHAKEDMMLKLVNNV